MLQFDDLVNDPDLGAQTFTVTRTSGVFGPGGFVSTQTALSMFGTIQPATEEHVDMFPEGNRPTGSIVIRSTQPIYRTRPAGGGSSAGLSDLITWNGEQYQVVGVMPWGQAGFVRAGAVRLGGQA